MKLKTGKIYLFTLRNGKRKLGYGNDPDDARRILSHRLTPTEMAQITTDPPERIRQQELQRWTKELG